MELVKGKVMWVTQVFHAAWGEKQQPARALLPKLGVATPGHFFSPRFSKRPLLMKQSIVPFRAKRAAEITQAEEKNSR